MCRYNYKEFSTIIGHVDVNSSVNAITLHFEYNRVIFIFAREFCVLLSRFIRALNLGDFTSSLEDQFHVGIATTTTVIHNKKYTRCVSVCFAGWLCVCVCVRAVLIWHNL